MTVKHFPEHAGLRGALDLPGAEIEARNGHVLVDGWMIAEHGRIASVFVRAVGLSTLRISHDVERLDVAEALGKPDAKNCGVRGTVVVPRRMRELYLELWVELDDGRRLCFDTRHGEVLHTQAPGQAVLELACGTMLRASVEVPGIDQVLEAGSWVDVKAWVWSNGEPIREAWLEDDRGCRIPLSRGGARPDVGEAFVDVVGTDRCGLLGGFETPNRFGPLDLELWVDLENGERHRCLSRRAEVVAPAPPVAPPERSARRRALVDRLLQTARDRIPSWVRSRLVGRREQRPSAAEAEEHTLHAHETAFRRWRETNRLTPHLQRRLRELASELGADGPRVSLLLPLHEASAKRVFECIGSVVGQFYDRWQLCVLDDGTSGAYLSWGATRAFGADPRIELVCEPQPGQAAALNRLLAAARGDFVALLDQDAVLPPDALLQIVDRIRQNPSADVIHTDEDRVDAAGRRRDPSFKACFNPALALTSDPFGRLTALRRSLVERAGGLRAQLEGAHEQDLLLRISELTTAERIHDIAKICCHRSEMEPPATTPDAAERAIAEALDRRALRATPVRRAGSVHQLAWSADLLRERPVTIVIPTRDRVELLERCVESLKRTVPADALELLIVDDESSEPRATAYLRGLERSLARCRVVRRPEPRTGFNFARLINFGASQVRTPAMLVLNNDIEALSGGWLEDMAGWLSVPDVAVVGASLLYPDRRVEHAGVVVGPHSGLADHMFRGIAAGTGGYLELARRARDVSAVTGACLLTSMEVFRELGGLDAEHFAVDYNDVDYCLRVRASGRRVVFTPGAELIHAGGASRGAWYDAKEHENFIVRHRGYRDPFVDANVAIDSLGFEPDPHHFCHADRAPERPRVLAIPSAVDESDPSTAFAEYLQILEQRGCEITLLTDRFPPEPDEDLAAFRGRARALLQRLAPGSVDVVIANGPRTIWGLELARTLDCPSLWHLEGRDDLAACVRHHFPASQAALARALLAEKLEGASRVVFPSDWALSLFAEFNRRDQHRVLPIGISIPAIDAFRGASSRASLRAKHARAEDDLIIALEDARAERGSLRRDTTNALGRHAGRLQWFSLDQNQALPLSPTRGPSLPRRELLGMADLLVLGESHELHPRAMLEAMALGVPIVGPVLPGVSDVIAHETEGFVFAMSERDKVVQIVRRCVLDADLRRRLGHNAAIKVRRVLDTSRLADRHLELVRETILSGI